MIINYRFVIVVIFYAISIGSLTAQDDNCYRQTPSGKTLTFKPSIRQDAGGGMSTEEWNAFSEKEKKRLKECLNKIGNTRAYEQVDRFHNYLKIISDKNELNSTKKSAARAAKRLFKDQDGKTRKKVPYKGVLLSNGGQPVMTSTYLSNYVDELLARSFKKDETVISWGYEKPDTTLAELSTIPEIDYPIEFKYTAGSNNIIVYNDTLPIERGPTMYDAYEGSIAIKERIFFYRRGLGFSDDNCKELTFKLRCSRRKDLSIKDPNKKYIWRVFLQSIDVLDKDDACSDIEMPPLPINQSPDSLRVDTFVTVEKSMKDTLFLSKNRDQLYNTTEGFLFKVEKLKGRGDDSTAIDTIYLSTLNRDKYRDQVGPIAYASISKPDSLIPFGPDTLLFQKALYPCDRVKWYTYFIPGLGFNHFRTKKTIDDAKASSPPYWIGLTAIWLGGIYTTVDFKLKADNSLRMHRQSANIEFRNQLYGDYTKNHNRFLYAGAGTIAFWILVDGFILRKDIKSYKDCKAANGEGYSHFYNVRPDVFQIDTGETGIGLTYKINF